MGKFVDLTGSKFGRLLVVSIRQDRDGAGGVMWDCKCECGKMTKASSNSLKRGMVQSCGCLHREKMLQHEDISGMKFNRLTAIRMEKKPNGRQREWLCLCDCGNETHVSITKLKSGDVKSCGCYQVDIKTTHGMSLTKEYKSWQHMKERCYKPKTQSYKYYGGRGISVCDEWLNSFENFIRDMGRCPNGCTLDRIDVNGNYEKTNCRWSDSIEQANNKRTNRIINYKGVNMTVSQVAKEIGVHPDRIHCRLSRGWSNEKAIQF